MAKYSGWITKAGRSEAIRLDKALFEAHPEFRHKAKVQANVIGRGKLLISVVDAFLEFLERDMRERPDRLAPLSSSRVAGAVRLTDGVEVE